MNQINKVAQIFVAIILANGFINEKFLNYYGKLDFDYLWPAFAYFAAVAIISFFKYIVTEGNKDGTVETTAKNETVK